MIPKSSVAVEGSTAAQVLRLVEALEEEDDVQKVAANFDIDEKILAEVG
jgi:transcriptional/translational regulatory protein YebC/TACO1